MELKIQKNMADQQKELLVLSDDRLNAIDLSLSNLRFETGAQCIILADIVGQLIAQVGLTGDLDVTNLVSLLAGSFAITFEMTQYLGEKEAFNLNYHEGSDYDVYTANVGEKLILTLIFDHRVQSSRIGMVWLYTKRTVHELREVFASPEKPKTDQVFDADFSASLSDKLDNLFD